MMQLYPETLYTQQPMYQQLKYLLELLKNKEIFEFLSEKYPAVFGQLEYSTIWEQQPYLMQYFMENPMFMQEIMVQLQKILYTPYTSMYQYQTPYGKLPYTWMYPQTSYNQDLSGLWTMLNRLPLKQMYYYQQPYSVVPRYL